MKCGGKTSILYMAFILDIFTYNFGKNQDSKYTVDGLIWLDGSAASPCPAQRQEHLICPMHSHRVRD